MRLHICILCRVLFIILFIFGLQKRQAIKQKAQDLISRWLPEEKILTLDKSADALNLLRKVGSQKQTDVAYRNKRPHLLAEEIEYTVSKIQFCISIH